MTPPQTNFELTIEKLVYGGEGLGRVDGRVVFQVKGFLNGNLHFRFMPDAIKALNIEAGRLLGWLRTHDEAAQELGCTVTEARRFFGSSQRLVPGSVRLLTAHAEAAS